MERLLLHLGDDPWSRLNAGPVQGAAAWEYGLPVEVSVQIRGAHSRRFPKKCLQVDCGKADLEFPFGEGFKVRRLHLNADYIDPTLMRSTLCFQLFGELGVPAPLSRHVALQVSDESAGLYVGLESVDADFCRRRQLPHGSIYYALNRYADFSLVSPVSGKLKLPPEVGYRPIEGADMHPLRRMLTAINLASDRDFFRVASRWLDLASYMRWLQVAVFVGNRDGFVHNYALYWNPDEARFLLIPWDYDATWGIDVNGRPARLDRVPVAGWNKLSCRLLADSDCRRTYKRTFRENLDGPLSPTAVGRLIDKLAEKIVAGIDMEPVERWRSARLGVEVSLLKRWAEQRRLLLLSQLEEI